jgi:hypothetical protein
VQREHLSYYIMAEQTLRQVLGLVAVALVTACGGVHVQSPIAGANGPPSTFVATTSEVRATRIITLRDGVTKAVAFRAATDLLSQEYSVDVSDQHAGFLMTPWQASFKRQGAPDLRYRTRVIIRFVGDDWKQASVRADANWQRGEEWDIGYDSKLLDDVVNDLIARIGKK